MNNVVSCLCAMIRRLGRSPQRVVVYVDGDSVSANHVETVLNHLNERFAVSQVRVFANINNRNVSSWSGLTKRQGLIMRHMPRLAVGKNGSDIALALDALELHLTRTASTYALIASDADFTPLVMRLKQDGAEVLGFGHQSTPETLRRTCTSFRQISDLRRTL